MKTVNLIENDMTIRQIELPDDVTYLPYVNDDRGVVPLDKESERVATSQAGITIYRAPIVPIWFKKDAFIRPDFVATQTQDPDVLIVWLAGSNKVGWIFDSYNQSFAAYKAQASQCHQEAIKHKAEATANALKVSQLRRNLRKQNLTWAGLLCVIVIAQIVMWIGK